jgi:hypothetical protein
MGYRNVLNRSHLLAIPITILVVVAIVVMVSVLSDDPPEPAVVETSPVGTLVVSVAHYPENAGNGDVAVESGGPCLLYGSLAPWGSAGPQLTVTDHAGRVVSIQEVWQGMWESSDQGARCVARVELSITDAPFYTFAISDVYKRTVLRNVLVDAGWHYEIVADVP